jgi:hypothetical protein
MGHVGSEGEVMAEPAELVRPADAEAKDGDA